jgi:Tfp pilus assembly protein PilX
MLNLFNFNRGKEKGSRGAVSLIMAMVVLSVVLAIALGSSFIISSGLMASSSHSDSVVAFYAAETGIEQALFDHKTMEPSAQRCGAGWTSFGVAQYCLNVTETTLGDYLTISKIQSIGEYKNARRSIEISF